MSTVVKIACLLLGMALIAGCILLLADRFPSSGSINPVVPTPNAYFSDYPMNMEMRSGMTILLDKRVIYLTHKVTYDGSTGKYRYYYRIEYKAGKEDVPILFKWDIIDGCRDGSTLFELTPGKPVELNFEHDSPPAMLHAPAIVYQKFEDESGWAMTFQALQPGPWPSGKYLPTGRNEVQQVVE